MLSCPLCQCVLVSHIFQEFRRTIDTLDKEQQYEFLIIHHKDQIHKLLTGCPDVSMRWSVIAIVPDRYKIRGERKMREEEGKVRWTKGPRREEAPRHYLAQIRKKKNSLPLCSLSLSHSYSAISSTRIVFSATHYYSYTRTFFSLPYSVLSPTHCDSCIRSPLPPSLPLS